MAGRHSRNPSTCMGLGRGAAHDFARAALDTYEASRRTHVRNACTMHRMPIPASTDPARHVQHRFKTAKLPAPAVQPTACNAMTNQSSSHACSMPAKSNTGPYHVVAQDGPQHRAPRVRPRAHHKPHQLPTQLLPPLLPAPRVRTHTPPASLHLLCRPGSNGTRCQRVPKSC